MQGTFDTTHIFEAFDARVIPYSSDGESLSISIQILGEVRIWHKDSH